MTLFETLIGNESVKTHLRALSAEPSLPHAFLFYGAEGIGKSLFAEAFARHRLGTDKMEPADLTLVKPEGKASLITMDQALKICDIAQKPPYEATSKWIIIDSAERFHPAAANALLKTLEEPIATTHFILITCDRKALLPTLASRCRPISFSPLSSSEVIQFLHRDHGVDLESAQPYALMAQGSLSRALRISMAEDLRPHISALLCGDLFKRQKEAKFLEEVCLTDGQIDRDKVDLFLDQLAHYFRDLTLKTLGEGPLYFPVQSLTWPHPIPTLEKVFHWIQKIKEGIARSVKLHVLLESSQP